MSKDERTGRRDDVVAWLPAVGVVAWLLATNRWSDADTWRYDAASYVQIAGAAPGLPDQDLGSAYADRWVPHYLVGLLHQVTGLSVHGAYRVAAVLCVLAVALAAAGAVRALGLPRPLAVLGTCAYLLSPYAGIRLVLLGPAMLQDLVFVLGLALTLRGLLKVSTPTVLLGLAVALCGRQTTVLVVPVVALWVLVEPDWRRLGPRARAGTAAAAVGVGALVYAALLAVASGFSYPFGPDGPSDTILLDPPGARELVGHLLRTASPLLVVVLAVFCTLAVLVQHGVRLGKLPVRVWLLLLVATAIAVQPLVISPDSPGFAHNEQRLVGIALLPVFLALADLVRLALAARVLYPSRRSVVLVVVALAAASLSHVFSWVGPTSSPQFLLVQVVAAAVVAGMLLRAGRAESERPTRTGGLGAPVGRGRDLAELRRAVRAEELDLHDGPVRVGGGGLEGEGPVRDGGAVAGPGEARRRRGVGGRRR